MRDGEENPKIYFTAEQWEWLMQFLDEDNDDEVVKRAVKALRDDDGDEWGFREENDA